ncbi:hypothetical protein GEMRC1_008796 [Eukaryota sp. GEM-RC1]
MNEWEKHIKYFTLKRYYSEKIPHLWESTDPSISLYFCRFFDDSFRGQFIVHCMCKSSEIVSFLEPVLASLFDDEDVDNSFGKNRGDVILFSGHNGSFTIADATTIDVCNDSNKKLAKSKTKNPLLKGEKFKNGQLC